MKKLIINLIHFWDLKLYERQIKIEKDRLISEVNHLSDLIHWTSEYNNDQELKDRAKVMCDRIGHLMSEQKKTTAKLQDTWNTAFKP